MKFLYEISVKGRVQGVGFRYFVRARALELNLKGFVRNTYNGDVLIEAEGDRDDLEIFLDYLRTGPPLARVDQLTAGKTPFKGMYDEFVIRY